MSLITTHLQYITLTLTLLLIVFLAILGIIRRRAKRESFRLPKDISEFRRRQNTQHQAIFVDLSPKSADVVELAIEIWRIKNRISKAISDLSEIQRRGLESSIQKLLRFLDRSEIKIIDHTDEKYNEGMNVDVLSFEKNSTIKTPIIKETVEPTITCQGHVVKKGKVIVITN